MTGRIPLVFAGLVAMLSTGCSYRLIEFTMISTKNVQLPTEGRGARISGEDCAVVFLGLRFGVPNMKAAIDRAIEKAGPDYDALVDGVVYRSMGLFSDCIKVEGTPINTKKGVAMASMEGKIVWRHSQPGDAPL